MRKAFIGRPAQEKIDEFRNRNILDIAGLSREDIEIIMETAAYYDQALSGKQRLYDMDGKIMASLFLEPSTRTRLSFEAAMERLGGKVISLSETPGVGAKVAEKEFTDGFKGTSGELKVNKDGGTIDAVAGATISSRAVTKGVNDALAIAQNIIGGEAE